MGEKEYAAFPYKELFHKIGAYSFIHEADQSGTYVGSSYLYGTARDYARFALLYAQNGRWNGQQILPENWVAQTVQPSQAANNDQYGFQFWLNGINPQGIQSYPDAPDDMYLAHGFGGQGIYIIPSKELIILRFGLDEYDENKFLKEVISAIK